MLEHLFKHFFIKSYRQKQWFHPGVGVHAYFQSFEVDRFCLYLCNKIYVHRLMVVYQDCKATLSRSKLISPITFFAFFYQFKTMWFDLSFFEKRLIAKIISYIMVNLHRWFGSIKYFGKFSSPKCCKLQIKPKPLFFNKNAFKANKFINYIFVLRHSNSLFTIAKTLIFILFEMCTFKKIIFLLFSIHHLKIFSHFLEVFCLQLYFSCIFLFCIHKVSIFVLIIGIYWEFLRLLTFSGNVVSDHIKSSILL